MKIYRKLIFTAVSFLLSACNIQTHESKNNNVLPDRAITQEAVTLHKSTDCVDLENYLIDAIVKKYTTDYPFRCVDCNFSTNSKTSSFPNNNQNDQELFHPNYKSNNLEDGGLDTVRYDKKGNIYLLNNGDLIIYKGLPAEELAEISRIAVNKNAVGLYLNEDENKIIVISRTLNNDSKELHFDSLNFRGSNTVQKGEISEYYLIDISDPAQPFIANSQSVEGELIDTKYSQGTTHIITRYSFPIFANLENSQSFQLLLAKYWEKSGSNQSVNKKYIDTIVPQIPVNSSSELGNQSIEEIKGAIRDKIRDLIDSAGIDSFLPNLVVNTKKGPLITSLLSCPDIYRPNLTMKQANLIIITSINDNGIGIKSSAITNEGEFAYSTQDYFYVAQPNGPNQQTAIHKFSIDKNGSTYLATGVVDGIVRNYQSMHAFNNYLRVISDKNSIKKETNELQLTNNLTILEDVGNGVLAPISELNDIAIGESVSAVQWTENKGFVLTYPPANKLHIFDLSDPVSPKLASSREVSGSRSFAQLLDESHLLTIGSTGTEKINLDELEVQLLDINDITNPAIIHTYSPNNGKNVKSWSIGEQDHRAVKFVQQGEMNTVFIPLTTYNWDSSEAYSGILELKIDLNSGFDEIGRINHLDIAKNDYCKNIATDDTTRLQTCSDNTKLIWMSTPKRTIAISQNNKFYVYTISDIGIKASTLENPDIILGQGLLPK